MTMVVLAGRSRSSILWVGSNQVSHLQPQSWRDVVRPVEQQSHS